jgi:hypothetical protein
MRIEVTPIARDELTQCALRYGLTQLAACSKIIEFVCHQDCDIQASILGLMPKLVEMDPAIAALTRMAIK